tara:strand:- start:154 stop:435 length:282 start_codon:yes stop_codon:yes gene_type:complete
MAFKRWQRSPSKKAPVRYWHRDEVKIIGWCMNIGIKISIMPDWEHILGYWQIDINIKGKTHSDPTRYSSEDVLNKKLQYYKYYYYKHNTNKNG